ncbi:MAG TPA: type II secretion system protein [Candidatus Saccharimonadales bacterium]|nr:type II secretion system protein [Candidatus Saccharimonadales bacterium]
MKNAYKRKRQEGFTIIEVMIVLAIAAVILLIVLLAVPALQRNSRNTQRTNDAASIAAAINTCLANHNSQVASCEATGVNAVDIDLTKLGQIETVSYVAAGGPGTTKQAVWSFNHNCNADGTAYGANPSSRQFAVTFKVESTGADQPRCIQS